MISVPLQVAGLAFLSIMGAVLLGLLSRTRLRAEHVQEETIGAVRLVTNLFVVMTSVLFALMLNSARNTLEANNRNISALATEIILLDRTLRELGREAEDARHHLVEYVQVELQPGNVFEEDPKAEALLEAAGTRLKAIRVSDEQKISLWNDALVLYRQIVREYWFPGFSGTIPTPLVLLLILWMAIIFASFGYQAPRNTFVIGLLVLAALLISAALYLIVDMGVIQASKAPFQRALAQLQR